MGEHPAHGPLNTPKVLWGAPSAQSSAGEGTTHVQHVTLAVLVFARAAGMMAAAPGFGLSEVPLKVRFAAAAMLVPIMAPVARVSGPGSSGAIAPGHLPMLAAKEAVVGLAIGFAASLLFYGVGMAGQLVAVQLGFLRSGPGLPQAFDGGQVGAGIGGPIARFYYLLAIVTYFSINGHHWLLAAAARSYAQLPVDVLLPRPQAGQSLATLASDMFVIALQVGAPALAALFLVDIVMAAAGRAVPALGAFTVGLPVRCGVGIVALAASAPLIGAAVAGHVQAMHEALLALAGTL